MPAFFNCFNSSNIPLPICSEKQRPVSFRFLFLMFITPKMFIGKILLIHEKFKDFPNDLTQREPKPHSRTEASTLAHEIYAFEFPHSAISYLGYFLVYLTE
uniref:Uncharacterized protein n=2 Tax=Lepeophtheirus salmonis TaxID=72036 RepID=A0A0K2TD66_LEPSM